MIRLIKCILLLSLVWGVMGGCDWLHERRIWSNKDKFIGHYKLNPEKSL